MVIGVCSRPRALRVGTSLSLVSSGDRKGWAATRRPDGVRAPAGIGVEAEAPTAEREESGESAAESGESGARLSSGERKGCRSRALPRGVPIRDRCQVRGVPLIGTGADTSEKWRTPDMQRAYSAQTLHT